MANESRTQIGTLFRPFDATPTLTDHGVFPPASSEEPGGRSPAITVGTSLPRSDGNARYTVKSILGRGGMGEVRLCRDDRIGREIAVKVMLPPSLTAPSGTRDEMRARFIREARVQGQLEHPAIVPVHEVEVLDDGTAYFTMKRVRGQTLSSVIAALAKGDEDATRRFTRRALLQAFATVCLAVDFAHARGVVHRDLKPQNIMLGDFGEVYVLDWGVAKLLNASDDDDDLSSPGAQRPTAADAAVRITGDVDGVLASRAGSILGTPGYMAPEQIDPARAQVAPATDVYALGAILFEILAWRPVLETKTNELELVVQTLKGVDARASLRAPERAIPAHLDAVCAKALALDPADRFASARALWSELERFLDGEQDIERRRAQSTAHAQAAEKLVADAADDDADPKRTAAYGELSRALALDPDNATARQTLLRLLTAPSGAAPPAEVSARLRAFDDETERLGSMLNAPVILPWLALLPVSMWAGIRDWTPVVIVLALLAVVSGVCLYLGTRKHPSRALQTLGTLLTFAAYIGLSWLFGPFVLAPALFSMYAVTMQTHPSRLMQRTTVALSVVAVAFSMVLEYVTGASYLFEDGSMVMVPRTIAIERTPTFLLVGLGTIIAILFTTTFIARVRARLADAERALALQAWRLERLVPK
jgi:serine/threonine protein kinase